ncbi:MAG: putative manganese-dependent inorganic diphosphatase [Verrucomicrobiota bacterium]
MNEILVIGHRNPDTDAICSAIAYAEFKRRTGMPNAIAARCGDTNDRIDFVLKTFGVPAPRFVADVSPKVRDVMRRNVVSVPPDATVAEALAIMDEDNLRALPVLDEQRRCQGLVSVFKMNQYYLPAPNRLFDSRRVRASLNAVARTTQARLAHVVEPDREEDFTLMIGAMSLDAFRTRLEKFPPEKLIIVVGDRLDVQQLAVQSRVRAIMITGGLQVDRGVLELAKRNGVSLLLSMHDSATTAMLCRAAMAVWHIVDEQMLSFSADELIAGARRRAVESDHPAFPVTNEQGEMLGVLSKSDFLKRVDRQLILVDHNELSQAVQGAAEVEIIEIIDHHRIGALTTHQPILFRNEPVGSTSTIVADCFLRHGVELPREIAGLLLAGLVSDTLNLTSPTSTPRDAEILRQLEARAGVNATAFTESLFSSGSVLTSRPPAQAVATDCKEYVERGRRFSVAQIEEIGFEQFWKRKTEVLQALLAYRQQKNYTFAALLVTDVTTQASLLLMAGEAEVLELIDYPELEPGIYELSGVVSRKKQLLPYLAHCLARLQAS